MNRQTVDPKSRLPTTCYCCGRKATGVGFGDFKSDPKYLCPQCVLIFDQIASLTKFDGHERAAIDMAGELGGAFLDEIGKTDLALLDPEQWHVFLRTVVDGFAMSLRKVIRDGEVPF